MLEAVYSFHSHLCLILCLLIVLTYWRFADSKRRKAVLKYPPGPWNLPIFGYMPFLSINPYKQLEKLGKAYGSIFTIFLGKYRVIVLNDHNVIRDAYKEDAFSGRPDLNMLEVRNGGIRKGLVCSQGRVWMEQRKFTLRRLKDLGLGKHAMEGLIREELNELVDGIRYLNLHQISYFILNEMFPVWTRKQAGTPVNLLTRLQLAVLNALWKITCGERYNHDDNRLLNILKKTGADLADTQYTGPLLFLPWLVHIAPMLTRWKTFVSSITTVHQFLKRIIEAHKNSFRENTMRDFIDDYLEEIANTKDRNSSFYGSTGEHSLLITLLDLFMAGGDTTSTTLYWAFLYMILYQNVQKKVQNEIDNVLGRFPPSLEHRKRMPYTEATIKEILRKSSLVPLGLFHSTTDHTNFFGYDIPKDTVIIANLHNCHNNRNYWTDPENFRPERFIGDDGNPKKYNAFMPFSTGKRVCPGESLARDELFLFFVGLLQHFTFTVDPSNSAPTEKPKIGIVLSPKPFTVIATERF
ncbi:Methyl farnesoate epoxidase, partial [Orchesella cincta]